MRSGPKSIVEKIRISSALICVAIIMFGIVYNVVALPFSSPTFDLISWIVIGVAVLILAMLGSKKSS